MVLILNSEIRHLPNTRRQTTMQVQQLIHLTRRKHHFDCSKSRADPYIFKLPYHRAMQGEPVFQYSTSLYRLRLLRSVFTVRGMQTHIWKDFGSFGLLQMSLHGGSNFTRPLRISFTWLRLYLLRISHHKQTQVQSPLIQPLSGIMPHRIFVLLYINQSRVQYLFVSDILDQGLRVVITVKTMPRYRTSVRVMNLYGPKAIIEFEASFSFFTMAVSF